MLQRLVRLHYLMPWIVVTTIIIATLLSATLGIVLRQSPTEAIEIPHGLDRQELLDITNWFRGLEGRSPLAADSRLNAVAQARAEHMAALGYFGHDYNGLGSLDREEAKRLGYASPSWWLGENLYAEVVLGGTHDTADDNLAAMQAWANSHLHRQNMMHAGHKAVGFGWAQGMYNGAFYTFVVAAHGEGLLTDANPKEPTHPILQASYDAIAAMQPPAPAPTTPPVVPDPEPEPEPESTFTPPTTPPVAPEPAPSPAEPPSVRPVESVARPSSSRTVTPPATEQPRTLPQPQPEQRPSPEVGTVQRRENTPRTEQQLAQSAPVPTQAPAPVSQPQVKQAAVTSLPTTGAGEMLLLVMGVGVSGYVLMLLRHSRSL